MSIRVFIAMSLDGYIADSAGGIEWLTSLPSPSQGDAGYSNFLESIDAIVMGRKTFEKVLSFGGQWPYTKPVIVLSRKMRTVEARLAEQVEVLEGTPSEVVGFAKKKGYQNLYIDGGQVIQEFMRDKLVNELVITLTPIVLGAGIPLFQSVPATALQHCRTETFDNGMVQIHYRVA